MKLLNEILRASPSEWGDACISGWTEACVVA